MRLYRLLGIFALLLCNLIASSAAPGYTIKGKFTGLADGTVLELIPSGTHDDEKPVATAVLKGGQFSFSGTIPGPRLFRISVKGHYGGCQVMVDNSSNITVTATGSTAERYKNKFLDLQDLKVSGSKLHEEYLKKTSYREKLNQDHMDYNRRGEAIMKQVSAARQAKDSVKLDSLYKTAAYKKFEADEKVFFDKVEVTFDSLITANKDSWWGAFLMLNAYSYFTPEQKPVFNKLSQTAQESYYGQKIKDELFPKGFLGEKAPLFEAMTNDKKDADLSQLLKGNKYTLVDFWASWCQPCRKSIPALKSLYADMNAKGLQIVSLSIDKKEADWLKAEKEEQLAWPSFLDKGATSAAWKIRTIPAMFLLDEKGTVVAENVTIAQVRELMK
ncbi:TlpA disulfide reductase family protein [Pedobacter deserti]|uniref:TlpA disulfide reductase family protein n=1 Tax=Pedobacter deserti TaxID=2817382 RepID=UPI0021093497|nr:TlpA disulfide reductase family protein [Pedobacter sp. SYSU D00382]